MCHFNLIDRPDGVAFALLVRHLLVMDRLAISPRLFSVAAALLLAATAVRPLAAQSLRGSEESVDRMYDRAHEQGLFFYMTASGVRQAAREGEFVKLANTRDLKLARMGFPFVRAATRTFVQRLAAEYHDVCGERLVVTSGVRPLSLQPRNGSPKSVHPTGMAIDLRKPKRSGCREWLRDRLLQLEARGVIEATEEFHPPHFHVAVFGEGSTLHASRATE